MKYYFLPPHLDIDNLNTHLTDESRRSQVTENTCLLFTHLCCKLVSLKGANNISGYTQIHSDKLEKILGKTYYKVINTLLDNEYIEVCKYNEHGQYFEKGYASEKKRIAKSYRIHPRLLSTKKLYTKEPINSKRMIIKVNDLLVDATCTNEYYRNLVIAKMRNLVLIDTPESRAVITTILTQASLPDVCPSTMIDLFNHDVDKRFVVCDFGRRVHAAITRMHKLLRPFLRFSDSIASELVELDIVCSQMFFLAAASSNLIKKFAPECAEAIPLFKAAEDKEDVVKFKRLTEAGTIYEYIQEQYEIAYGIVITRPQAKVVCYTAFFGSYVNMAKGTVQQRQEEVAIASLFGTTAQLKRAEKRLESKKCYELFKSLFPHLHDLFFKIKRLDWQFGQNGTQKPKRYANNCLLAQRIESGIMYTRVVKALVAEGITDVVTVHDALVVKKQDAAKANKIFKREMNKLGLKPKVS